MRFPDTIFALSSGAPPAGVAVIRLSGTGVRFALEMIFGRVPEARRASYGSLRDLDGLVLDHGLVLFFPEGASVTGEDVGEVHVHRGRATVAAVLDLLSSLPEFRLAEAGEFTRRAFLNGRMDLLAVEALGDLLVAETELQLRAAVSSADGRLRDLYESWREALLGLRATVEADLDFSDQDDASAIDLGPLRARCEALAGVMRAHLDLYARSEIVRSGYMGALVGAPNAGKSSLLNALAMRDIAIVSPEAGTTRDLIECALDLRGQKVVLIDTAGIREAAGPVERIGVQRALDAASTADLVLELVDLSSSDPVPHGRGDAVRVWTKADVNPPPDDDMAVSALTGAGLDRLLDLIERRATAETVAPDTVVPFKRRQVDWIQRAAAHLDYGARAVEAELLAEELRLASDALARLTGRLGVEDVLSTLFGAFCIGK